MDSLKIILLLIVLINFNQNEFQCEGHHDDDHDFNSKAVDEFWSGTQTSNQQDNKSGQKVDMKVNQKFTQQKPSHPYLTISNYYTKLMSTQPSPNHYSNDQSDDEYNNDQDDGNQNDIESISHMAVFGQKQQICKVKLIPFINMFCVHGVYSFSKLITILFYLLVKLIVNYD